MYSLFILIPLFSVIVLNLPFRKTMQTAAYWWALALAATQVCLVLLFFADHAFSAQFAAVSTFLKFNLHADYISRVMLLCIGMAMFVTLMSAKQIIRAPEKLFNFANLLLIALMGMNGVALVTDIFSLYVFIEVVAASSFILIAFDKEKLALEAAFKYIILSAVASAMMLSAIALLMLVSGDTGFGAINAALNNSTHTPLVNLAIGIFICALFIKGGLMPFHGWLPDAYSAAPAPVSVLLAGVVTKVVGIYALARIMVSVIGFANPLREVLLLIGAASIVFGALAALGQQDFKRMLAYSSISQVGYIIIGLGCATPIGIFGAIFHLFNHSVFKSTLFINSAAVEMQSGTRDMDRMGGLASRMPVTGATSVISFLSAAGIPPLAGFWSKFIIVVALWIAGYYWYAVIGLLAGTITLAYFLSLQRRVFFGKLKQEFAQIKEAGPGLVLPMLILGAITIAVGLGFPFILSQLKF